MSNRRLATKRETIASNRATLKSLTSLINAIVKELALDDERMAKRMDAALRSEYGPINGMVNLVVSISNWPAEPGDGSMISVNRQILTEKFGLDLLLLDDIKTFKGYHTFVSSELEVIEGVAPQYEDYADYCQIFLEELAEIALANKLNKPVARLTKADKKAIVIASKPTIDETRWVKLEAIAQTKAKLDLEDMVLEVERHKAFLDANQ